MGTRSYPTQLPNLTAANATLLVADWSKWGPGGIALGPAVWASADGGRQYMNQDSLVTAPELADGLVRHPEILPV